MEDWFQLVVSCYPLRKTRGMQKFRPQRNITDLEHSLLIELLRKQRVVGSTTVNKLPVVQMLLSKLTVIVVGYCWTELTDDDWEFVLYKSRYWIESTVILMEEVVESVNETITGGSTVDIPGKLQQCLLTLESFPLKLAKNALISFSLFCEIIEQQQTVENESDQNLLRSEKRVLIKDRILEGVLRLFFSTGAAEAIAGSYSSVIALSRVNECHFWELIASCAVESSSHARDRAIKSLEIWGLSKGAVSSLYAILFSSKPVPYLQYAAYVILSSEPVADSAFVVQEISSSLLNNNEDSLVDSSLEAKILLREEISIFLDTKLSLEILELDLVAPERVSPFISVH